MVDGGSCLQVPLYSLAQGNYLIHPSVNSSLSRPFYMQSMFSATELWLECGFFPGKCYKLLEVGEQKDNSDEKWSNCAHTQKILCDFLLLVIISELRVKFSNVSEC